MRKVVGVLLRHLLQILVIFHGNIPLINLWMRLKLAKKKKPSEVSQQQ